jgi:exopolysaccharide biosynthesis polyprenyl glycosylphosphotransferase
MKEKFWHGKKKFFFVLLYLSDVLAFLLAVFFGSRILNLNIYDWFFLRFYLFGLLILILFYSNYKLYNNKRNLFDDTDFMNILYANIITFIILVIFTLMFAPDEPLLIPAILIISALSVLFTGGARVILSEIIVYARDRGFDVKRTVFFGEENDELVEKLKDKHLGYNLIKITHNVTTLKKYLPNADIVFIKMEAIDDKMLELMTTNDHINWKIVSSILNLVIDPVAFDEFKDYPIINVTDNKSSKGYLKIKRLGDILFSGISLLILSPLFLIIAVIIKLTSKGPVFFTQSRLGKELKPFKLYKFRSMREGADAQKTKLKNEVNGLFKMKNDPRITPIGKFLRRTCIDELPQLINIFIGDMSIVGPRPHLKSELGNFQGWRMARFKVKPGLTGMWQVNGRHELNFDKAVLYDVYYVKHLSLQLDTTIILKTIPAIVMNKGRF